MLVEVKRTIYIDCTADMEHPSIKQMGDIARSTMLPMHVILKVIRLNNDQLTAVMINKDKLIKLLQENKFNMRYESIDDEHLLLVEKEAVR